MIRPAYFLLRSNWHRRFWLVLAAVALLLRAVLPSGYMPDLRAASKGELSLTLCNAYGELRSIRISLKDKQESPPTHDGISAFNCPFAVLAAQALLPPSGPVLAAPVRTTLTQAFLPYRSHAIVPAAGPPLGSRAPPAFVI